MGKILLMPLNKKTVSPKTLEILRAEQLHEFAEQVDHVFYRARETEDFTKNLLESDNNESICFYDVCLQILSFNQKELDYLQRNRYKYQELASKYKNYVSKEPNSVSVSKLVLLDYFDSDLPRLISEQFEDMNYIIKNINKGKVDASWYNLYEYYRMLHYDGLAKIVVDKMAELGDEYAQILQHSSVMSFDDLSDMIIEIEEKDKDK